MHNSAEKQDETKDKHLAYKESPKTGAAKQVNSPKRGQKNQLRQEQRRRKRELLADPAKIVESILERSTYREPNLSQIVNDHLLGSTHYTTNLEYPVTVGETVDGMSDVSCSVFPSNFDGTVNVGPSSIMILPCIYTIPRVKRRLGNKRKAPEPKAKQTVNAPTVQTDA